MNHLYKNLLNIKLLNDQEYPYPLPDSKNLLDLSRLRSFASV